MINFTELLDAVLPTAGDTSMHALCDKVWAYAEEQCPEDFEDWVKAEARSGIKAHIRSVLASRRQQAQSVFRQQELSDMVDSVADGTPVNELMSPISSAFRQLVCVGYQNGDMNDQIWRPIGKLVDDDCFYRADVHADLSRSNAYEEAFWREVGKRLQKASTVKRKKTLEEIFTEEQYISLRRDRTGRTDIQELPQD